MSPKRLSRLSHIAVTVILAIATLAMIWFANGSYRSLRLLQSAQEIGLPQVSTVRGWMSIDYVAQTYGVPRAILVSGLDLPADSAGNDSLRVIAERQGVSPFDYVQRVQKVLATLLSPRALNGLAGDRAADGLMDWVLTTLQRYGYPALAFVLFFGAVGVPVPAGLSAALAGSLIALGQMQILPVAGIAIGASLVGDAAGYSIGRWLDGNVLAHYGRWIGYTRRRHERARALFDQLGALTILLTRTLVSSLSSLVNLFAGASRYYAVRFLVFAAFGRVLWTSAYVGLGYVIAGEVEAAALFLRHLTGLLITAAAVAGLTLYVVKPALFARRIVNNQT